MQSWTKVITVSAVVLVALFLAFYVYRNNTGGIEIQITNISKERVHRMAMFRRERLESIGGIQPGETIHTRIWPQGQGESFLATFYMPRQWDSEDHNPTKDPNLDAFANMPDQLYLSNQMSGRLELTFDGYTLRIVKNEIKTDPAIPLK